MTRIAETDDNVRLALREAGFREAVWAMVEANDPKHPDACWTPRRAHRTQMPPTVQIFGSPTQLIRVIWIAENGSALDGMRLENDCGNNHCLRPAHWHAVPSRKHGSRALAVMRALATAPRPTAVAVMASVVAAPPVGAPGVPSWEPSVARIPSLVTAQAIPQELPDDGEWTDTQRLNALEQLESLIRVPTPGGSRHAISVLQGNSQIASDLRSLADKLLSGRKL